jgi:histone H3/H4
MVRVIKKAGAVRVSEDAKTALADILEDIAGQIASKAASIASASSRKTLKSEDVRLAVKDVWG